jgi:ribosomal-protein-alanine N-acetyltransferase
MPNIFETDRLLMKALNKNSAPLVLSFYEDNRFLFEPWEPQRGSNFYTLAYQKASLTAEHNQMTEGKLLRYWVFLKDAPDEIIGSICFQNLLKGPYQSCSLGYKFSHKHLHQGYAFESIHKAIETIFEEYHLHRIEAFIMPNNEPSLRLIDRLFFICEGLSYSYAKVNGIWTDHKRYSLINPDGEITTSNESEFEMNYM